MKKIISLILLFACMFIYTGTQAQTYNAKVDGLDTLSNGATQTTTVTVTGTKSSVGFQVNVIKISGTVAGTIVYQGSKDGTNYESLETDSLTDASGVFGYSASYNGYAKYRIVITTTGTQASSYSVWALYRK